MSVALLVSLVLALSFTPALAAAVEPAVPRRAHEGPGDRISRWLAGFYARGLRWTLEHHRVALLTGLIPVAIAVVALRHVETGFVPEMDEGSFVLDFWSPAGTSLDETDRLLGVVDDVLSEAPEVTSFSRRTGAELGFFLTETNRGDYAVRLRDGGRRPIEEVMDDVREQIHARVPGLRVEFVQILQDMIGDLSGNPSPVEIKLFGSDQEALTRTAADANALLAEVPGIVDNFDGVTAVGPTYEVNVDELQARRAGLSADAVRRWVETAMTGSVVGQVLEGDRAIPLRLWYPERFRQRLDSLADLTLITPQGRLAPLAAASRSLEAIGLDNLSARVAVTNPEDEVGRMVTVLNRMLARLEGAVSELQRFTADAAHELRTPLTVLHTGLEVALSRDRSVEDYREALRQALAATDRIHHLAEELLTQARLEALGEPVDVGPIDVSEVLHDLAEAWGQVAAQGEMELAVNAASHLNVRGNADDLYRLFNNLIDNALRHSPRGGCVSLTAERGPDHIEVLVEDRGPGILPEERERAFDRIYRGDGRRTADGTGLGLSIAQQIARMHGGRIVLSNRGGGGCIARVTLPPG